MMSRSAVTSGVDLGADDLYATGDPWPMWQEFAAADTVSWTEPGSAHGGFWSVFSHRACGTVLAADAPFTSEYGIFIGFDADHPDTGSGRMIVVSDGDRHEHLRRLMTTALARSMNELPACIEPEVRRFVAEAREQGEVDVTTTLAARLPNLVISEILGIPAADREQFAELSHFAAGAADHTKMSPSEAHTRMMFYFSDLIEERQSRPRDDFISHLLHAGNLSPTDVLMNCDNVVTAGNVTTQQAITGCFHALSTVAGVLDRLRGDPRATRLAVEEVLRWTTPGTHMLRVATKDTEINGQPVRAGAAVVAWLAAANRDERVFDEPHRFRPDRQPNGHLGFGHGAHYCLGAAVARTELRTIMRIVADEAAAVSLTAEPQWQRSNRLNAYRRLRVELAWR